MLQFYGHTVIVEVEFYFTNEADAVAQHVICDIEKRFIFLRGQIKPISAILIENALQRLVKHNASLPICFFISSAEGGDAYASLRIFQMIRHSPLVINTIAVGVVYSGALLILQAGKKRFAVSGTKHNFHMAEDTFLKGQVFNAQRYMAAVDTLMLIDAGQFLIFTERGRPVAEIKRLFRSNAKISAQKALKLNLIDGIVSKNTVPKT